MSEEDVDIEVTRNSEKSRYEAILNGQVAGYTAFQPDSRGRLVFNHTVVDPAFEGRGIGRTLVGNALADVAVQGETIVPVCPFVIRYLRGHDVPGLKIDWRDDEDTLEAAGGQSD